MYTLQAGVNVLFPILRLVATVGGWHADTRVLTHIFTSRSPMWVLVVPGIHFFSFLGNTAMDRDDGVSHFRGPWGVSLSLSFDYAWLTVKSLYNWGCEALSIPYRSWISYMFKISLYCRCLFWWKRASSGRHVFFLCFTSTGICTFNHHRIASAGAEFRSPTEFTCAHENYGYGGHDHLTHYDT